MKFNFKDNKRTVIAHNDGSEVERGEIAQSENKPGFYYIIVNGTLLKYTGDGADWESRKDFNKLMRANFRKSLNSL